MAKIPQGITGPIHGTIGSIVGSKWRSTPYIKSKAEKSDKPRSAKQIASQEKFKFLQNFLATFRPYFIVGFQNESIYCSEWNSAFSANHHAVTGVFPDFNIDYRQVKLSSGLLPGLQNPEISFPDQRTLQLKWQFVDGQMISWDDQVTVVVYSAERQSAYGMVTAIGRAAKSLSMPIDPRIIGQEIHVFIYLSTVNRRVISNTQYLGKHLPG